MNVLFLVLAISAGLLFLCGVLQGIVAGIELTKHVVASGKKKKWSAIILICLVLSVFFGYGAYVSYDASKSTLNIINTPTTPSTSFADTIKNQPTVNTDFLDNQWNNGNQTSGTCSPNFQTNSLDVVANKSIGKFSCMLRPIAIAGDMALQVTAMITDGNVAGVTFKDNNSSSPHHYYYRYTIDTSTGFYQLVKGLGDKSKIIDAAPIRSGLSKGENSINILEVTVRNQNICLYVNKILLHCIKDTSIYDTGTIGLYVGVYPGDVIFSHLTVWQLN